MQGQFSSILSCVGEDDKGLVEDLTSYYARYGLTRGQHGAKLLIKDIEAQAKKHAELFLDKIVPRQL